MIFNSAKIFLFFFSLPMSWSDIIKQTATNKGLLRSAFVFIYINIYIYEDGLKSSVDLYRFIYGSRHLSRSFFVIVYETIVC